MAGIGAILPIISAIGSIGGMLMGQQSAPQMLPPPPAPAPAPAPPAPEVAKAADVAVGDAQAAQQSAQVRRKRAKAAEDQRLMTLDNTAQTSTDTVELTKSLLGD